MLADEEDGDENGPGKKTLRARSYDYRMNLELGRPRMSELPKGLRSSKSRLPTLLVGILVLSTIIYVVRNL